MSFSKVFNKKLVIGLTVAAIGATSAVYGLKSKASDNQKEKDYYEDLYEIGMDEPTEEDIDWANENVVQIESTEEFYDFIEDGEIEQVYNDEDVVDNEADEEYDISSAVDNSKSKYFPPIEDQGSGLGACVSYSQVYYLFTYTYNKAFDIESKGEEHLFSPMWSWNQVGKSGTPVTRLLQEKGCVTMAEDQMVKNSSEIDKGKAKAYNYYADADLQRAALNRRITGEYSFKHNFGNTITGPDAEMLQPIKAALSNGEILSVTTLIGNWRYEKIQYNSTDDNYKGTSNKKYKGESICGRCDVGNGGGHRVTLVGYDDNIWLDINHNGKKEKAEMGAFKIANSWGKDWRDGNDGFIWLSYDALNTVSQTEYNPDYDINLSTRDKALWDFAGYVVRTEYPKQYAQFTIVSDDVKEIDGTIIAEDGAGNPSDYDVYVLHRTTSNYADPNNNGSTEINKGFDSFGQREGTFVVALDNVIPDINSTSLKKYTWKMRFTDSANEVPMTIKDVKIIDEETNKEYKDIIGTEVVKDGEEKDIVMDVVDRNNSSQDDVKTTTIYYSGYKFPNIHYCVDGQNWTNVPGVQMATNFDVYGFDHVAVIELNGASGVTVCFNDGNNNWDSNNGRNYRFGKGVYTYKNGEITEINDPDNNECSVKLIPSEYSKIGSQREVTLTAKSYGMDKNSVKYKFSYYNATDKFTCPLDNVTDNTALFKPYFTGRYNLKVEADDALGNHAEAYINNYIVEKMQILGLVETDVASPMRIGGSVKLSLKTLYSSNEADVSYAITDSNGKTKYISAKGNSTAIWTPEAEGKYTISASVRLGSQGQSTGTREFNVLDANGSVRIDSFSLSDSKPLIGQGLTAFAELSGGTLPYNITFGYYNTDNNKVVLSSQTTSYNYFSSYFMAPSMDRAKFFLEVEDADGNKKSSEFTQEFGRFKITGVTVNPADSVKLGETVTFTSKTENERMYKAPNTRTYIITNNTTKESETLYFYNDDATWTPAKAGNYTITLKITSYMTGSDAYTFNYKVIDNNNNKLYIDKVDTSIQSPAKLGDTINFNVYTVNEEADNSNYILYTITNKATNETTEYRDNIYSDNTRFAWTPAKAGKYTVDVKFVAKNGEASYSFDYEVKDAAVKNAVTIYYNGFSNPYIHYSMNGYWTNGNGIAMTPTNEMEGYTHKVVIELKDGATGIIACFNDGNNNWDSNCGRNYTFAKGEYTYSNGRINNIGEVVESKTTIYYKGYNTPYMHYSINGNWTNVPGVAMEQTSEKAGYTHKITVDMTTASELIACFNDGNNNWDSNNGRNYKFGIGTYYYSNGNIVAE